MRFLSTLLFVFYSLFVFAQSGQHHNAVSQKVIQVPDYAGLSGVVFHGRFDGLVNNTNNGFGQVDASNNVLTWKSVSPHATGNDFDDNGTSPVLTSKGISFGGAGNFRHTGSSSVFNFMHYNATLSDLKWAVHGVVKIGSSSAPSTVDGIIGNGGGTTTNKGISLYYDDASGTLNNSLVLGIYRGVSDSFIQNSLTQSLFTPDLYMDFWMEVDMSQAQEDQTKIFFDGLRYYSANYFTSSSPTTTPTYAMEIGAVGNGVLKGTYTLKELTIQSSLNTSGFRDTLIAARMSKYGITPPPPVFNGITIFDDRSTLDTFDENRYYLDTYLCQNPTDTDVIVSLTLDMVNHNYEATSKISARVSTDKGLTWGSKSSVFDPSGAEAARDQAAGYDASGRLHMIVTTVTSFMIGATEKIWYLYSDDDGGTWSTPADITSAVPSDGLTAFRVHGKLIQNSGRLMCTMYKLTNELSAAATAVYLIYSDDGGTTWGNKTVASGLATYYNECDIIALSSTHVLIVERNDTSKEWGQSISTDNGDTWPAVPDALSFNESLVTAGPVSLSEFKMGGVSVIGCTYLDRDKLRTKQVFGKASSLISGGIAGWDLETKIMVHQGSSGRYLHYGSTINPDDDINSIGMWPMEYPANDTDNELLTFKFPTAHYYLVRDQLGTP